MLENHRKYKKVEGNINNADVVIVYGDVKGNIVAAKDVIVINGAVKGNLVNCENVAGLLAQEDTYLQKCIREAEETYYKGKMGLPITLRE